MADHYDLVIADLDSKLLEQEKVVAQTKSSINLILSLAGRTPRYSQEELDTGTASGPRGTREITRNEFYGKPLAACVREILERRAANGSVREATLEEIFAALEQGNYDLKKHGTDRDGMRRGVAISLAKNTKAFHKLPNGDFGLVEWYSSIRKERKGPKDSGGDGADEADEDLPPELHLTDDEPDEDFGTDTESQDEHELPPGM